MAPPHDIRAQLQSLSIPKGQRPAVVARVDRKWPRLAIAAVLAVAVVIAGYLGFRKLNAGSLVTGSSSDSSVKLIRVTARKVGDPGSTPQGPAVLTGTGKITSDHQVKVSTKVSGQIVSLHFEQGDRVTKGQVLARIEDVIYRARRDQAAAELEKAKATLEYNKFNFERVSKLHQSSDAPDIEYSDAKRWFEEAQAQLDAAAAALEFAQKALIDCEVVAPIAGVILERNVEVGDFVAAEGGRGAMANAQLATIADMEVLRVEVDVSELDISRLRPNMLCTIVPDAYKHRRYKGHVMWIDPGANYSKATVQVKVRIENPDDYLRVEGSSQIAFLGGDETVQTSPTALVSSAGVIWIPDSACRKDPDGGGRVFVVEDGRLRERAVTLGRRIGGEIEIVKGLEEGQTIAAGGLENLRDGQRLKT